MREMCLARRTLLYTRRIIYTARSSSFFPLRLIYQQVVAFLLNNTFVVILMLSLH